VQYPNDRALSDVAIKIGQAIKNDSVQAGKIGAYVFNQIKKK
jgi:hypothetical protein